MEAWRAELQRSISAALDDSDDDQQEALSELLIQGAMLYDSEGEGRSRVGGSIVGRVYRHRDREGGDARLFHDYFADEPVYNDQLFRCRYRMRRPLFLCLVDGVSHFDPWFLQAPNATGRLGLSTLQKCTAAIQMLAYGVPANAYDEYVRLSESTVKRWVAAIHACFGETYLQQPMHVDIEKQMRINSACGFPGMFASLDCMHWTWKNCPVAWQGQFQDKDANHSVILEAVADQSTWFWHAFFGLPGGNNDINVLDRSPFVVNMLHGEGRDTKLEVNGHTYPRYYLMTDGIYL